MFGLVSRRDGDPVAEGCELGAVAAKLAFGVDVAGVVVGAEVVEPDVCVDEQVPDHDEDGAGDGDEDFELAATFDDSPVAFAEEGVLRLPLESGHRISCGN